MAARLSGIDLSPKMIEEAEKKAIIQALKSANNNRTETARLLGISRRALYDKIEAYDLKV